jgi:hypothetical protein
MKVENTLFQPVALVLETQEEVDKIFALFNFTPLHRAFQFADSYQLLKKSDGYIKFHDILLSLMPESYKVEMG